MPFSNSAPNALLISAGVMSSSSLPRKNGSSSTIAFESRCRARSADRAAASSLAPCRPRLKKRCRKPVSAGIANRSECSSNQARSSVSVGRSIRCVSSSKKRIRCTSRRRTIVSFRSSPSSIARRYKTSSSSHSRTSAARATTQCGVRRFPRDRCFVATRDCLQSSLVPHSRPNGEGKHEARRSLR